MQNEYFANVIVEAYFTSFSVRSSTALFSFFYRQNLLLISVPGWGTHGNALCFLHWNIVSIIMTHPIPDYLLFLPSVHKLLYFAWMLFWNISHLAYKRHCWNWKKKIVHLKNLLADCISLSVFVTLLLFFNFVK